MGYPSGMGYGMMTQGTFNLDPRGTAVFHDGIDSKPAGMFIAAGFDPTYLPMMTDGVDTGDAWIYGLPNLTKEQVIEEAKRRYPVSAATGIPENEELMPVWTQITANCLLVDNSRNPNCATSTTTDGTTTDGTTSGTTGTTATTNTGTLPMIYHYGEEPEYEFGEMAEIGGLRLRSPRHLSYYGCPPQDYVLGVGCIPNLRMRTLGRRNL